MNLRQIAQFLNQKNILDKTFSGVSVDSRLTKPGNLFFALKGQNADGHAFLENVANLGAVGAVVDREYQGPDFGMILIRVNSPLDALQTIAKAYVASINAKIVAVTGSLGKTTTKDFIAHLLSSKYRLASSPGNSNSQIGLPLTILNHTKGNEEVLVIEMGMDSPGNIANLIDIAPPDISVITTVAPVHAVYFESVEHIAQAKAEIFLHPKTSLGIFHRSIPNFDFVYENGPCAKLTFGVNDPDSDYTIFEKDGHLIISPKGAAAFKLKPLRVLGKHNIHNFLAAATVARNLGVSWEEISKQSETLKLPSKRLELILRDGVTFINDSYNAALISIKAALDSTPIPKGNGRKIAVLGSMLELGSLSEQSHKEVAEYSLDRADIMLCLGKECAPIYELWKAAGKDVFHSNDRMEITSKLRTIIKPDDVVLLKGSRGTGVWKILDEL